MVEGEVDEGKRKGIPVWVWILLAVVILIPGCCLGALVLITPRVAEGLNEASRVMAKADIVTIEQALEDYAVQNMGHYPDSLQPLAELDENGASYLDADSLIDPWGNEYGYEKPSEGNTKPRVICWGADGVPGGDGPDTDFDNVMIREGDF